MKTDGGSGIALALIFCLEELPKRLIILTCNQPPGVEGFLHVVGHTGSKIKVVSIRNLMLKNLHEFFLCW